MNGVTVVKDGSSDAFMREFHSSAIGGHSGFNKTNSAIKVRYWWPRMTDNIRKYVTHPFELVGCDLMGPFQETENGFRYIFTATDYYTKWVEAFPIQTKSAKHVSACIKKLLYRHGAMNAILTDQGREFINEAVISLLTKFSVLNRDVGHRVTAAYHPQTNGLDERTNQTIKRALSKCVNGGQTDWDTRLDQEIFPTCPPEELINIGVQERESQQAETTEKVKINNEKAKFKQQRVFRNTHEKKKRRYTDIKVGDKVLKFNSARAWTEKQSRLRVKLEKDGKILKSLVSVNNVKLVLDETSDNNSNLEQHDMPNNAIRLYIDNLDANNNVNSLLQECAAICNTSKSPARMFRISKQVETCPVLSFVKEVTAMYGDLLPDMEDAVHRVKESGDPGTLLLTVLAKAYMEDLPPVDVLETLKSRPAFLSECPKPEGLTGSERLTVAGDGLEQQDLNTLEGNEWLNDKVLNSYAKLLAREATDSSEPSAEKDVCDPLVYNSVMGYWNVDFTQFDFVVVPWNKNGNHWVVLVARPNDLSVAVYDSLGADNRPLIERFCSMKMIYMVSSNFMSERLKIVNDGLQHWEPVSSTTNQQTDGSSCGLFVLMTLECLFKGKASWILRQVHVPLFRRYITDRLLFKGQRNTYLCDSFWCKDPKGRKVEWIQCDVCYRWWHRTCCSKPDVTITNNNQFQCEVCDAHYGTYIAMKHIMEYK
ncbi:POL4-like protein [Mya arenaria]|uniref:POL4-like protein n=1 Tax=Mya arenaria TaxID=6604 RepID=A0ABY7FHT7_MYAAR|nr:POL4-like protein [Mya arenaria]